MKKNKLYIVALVISMIILFGLYVILIVMNKNLRTQVLQQSNTIEYLIQKQSSYNQLLDSIEVLNCDIRTLRQDIKIKEDLLDIAEKEYHFRVIEHKRGNYTEYFLMDRHSSNNTDTNTN